MKKVALILLALLSLSLFLTFKVKAAEPCADSKMAEKIRPFHHEVLRQLCQQNHGHL